MSSAKPQVIVIGGGQAGLAAGYHLARAGTEFVILDAESRTGDQWRRRWDSLRLFTPAKHSWLPGSPWQRPGNDRPTKDETADYLADYVATWRLPVQASTRVVRVSRNGSGFVVGTDTGEFHAPGVIVATGADATPRVPALSADCDPGITQLHSCDYRNPSGVPGARALVVGFGTSGAEIAIELAQAGRQVVLAGRPTPVVPGPLLAVAGDVWWQLLTRVFSRTTPIGRRMAPQVVGHGAPLIGISPRDVRGAGVRVVGRIETTIDGQPAADGEPLAVDTVVWCTGFHGDFGWLDVPGLALDARGYPIAPFGLVDGVPGLGFVGMPFQTRLASQLLGGVGDDAGRVVAGLLAAGATRGTVPA